jgi:hypothetical protein
MKRQQKDQTEGVTEDDLNEIKQDISAFRYENLLIFFPLNLFIFCILVLNY